MRFLIVGIVVLLVVIVSVYLLSKKFIDSYIKYYRLGRSCFDRLSRTFNDVLDKDVIASESLTSLEMSAYLRGRDDAEAKYRAAQKRYADFIKS